MEGLREDVILEKIAEAIEVLQSRPRHALVQFEDNAVAVQDQFRTLVANLNPVVQNDNSAAAHDNSLEQHYGQLNSLQKRSMGVDTSSLGILRTSVEAVRLPQYTPKQLANNVEHLISSAMARFAASRSQLLNLSSSSFEWFWQDRRLDHLQLIFTLQQSRKARSVELRDRVLLLCACMLLADGFRDYELRNGWTSKQDVLVTGVLRGENPKVQKIGKHLRNYAHTLDSSFTDERKLDAGVRLGTKLNVINAIGHSQGFGSVLTLIFGFEISQVSRLAYSDITNLAPILSSQHSGNYDLKSAGIFNIWWDTCRERYAQNFSPQLQLFTHELPMQRSSERLDDVPPAWKSIDSAAPPQPVTSNSISHGLAACDWNQEPDASFLNVGATASVNTQDYRFNCPHDNAQFDFAFQWSGSQ